MEGGDLFGEDQAVLNASLQPDVCASFCSALVQTLVALSSPSSFFFPFPFAAAACSAAKQNHLSKRNQTFLLLQGWLVP